MRKIFLLPAISCLLGNMGLYAQTADRMASFGFSLNLQRPMGDYQTTVLDAGSGWGLGLRTKVTLSEHHGLGARLDQMWFPEGGDKVRGSNYLLESRIQVSELDLGLDYEYRFTGKKGWYLMAGPVLRRWKDKRSFTYFATLPGTIPSSYTATDSPSKVGASFGLGYHNGSGDCTDLRWVTSDYGDTGIKANAIQLSFSLLW